MALGRVRQDKTLEGLADLINDKSIEHRAMQFYIYKTNYTTRC
jgi:hypothetical protein